MNILDMLNNLNLVEIIFEILSSLTFLADIFIGGALIAALIRGFTKNFFVIVWRGLLFVLGLVLVMSLASTLIPYISELPITLKGELDGVAVDYKTLGEIISGMISAAGFSGDAAIGFYEVIMKNLLLFVAVPLLSIIVPLLSAITYPLIKLLIPSKIQKMKLVTAKIALSLSFSLIAIIAFAVPMANLVPSLKTFGEITNDQNVLYHFLNPQLVNFFELFTAEKSVFIKLVNLGSQNGLGVIFNSFTVGEETTMIGDALTELASKLNQIPFVKASS